MRSHSFFWYFLCTFFLFYILTKLTVKIWTLAFTLLNTEVCLLETNCLYLPPMNFLQSSVLVFVTPGLHYSTCVSYQKRLFHLVIYWSSFTLSLWLAAQVRFSSTLRLRGFMKGGGAKSECLHNPECMTSLLGPYENNVESKRFTLTTLQLTQVSSGQVLQFGRTKYPPCLLTLPTSAKKDQKATFQIQPPPKRPHTDSIMSREPQR